MSLVLVKYAFYSRIISLWKRGFNVTVYRVLNARDTRLKDRAFDISGERKVHGHKY